MNQRRYGIKRFYRPRRRSQAFDDTCLTDEWQLEVYLHAWGLMRKHDLRSVIDIGCGSAYKLITYLGDYETMGMELSPTYEWLRETYPDRTWLESDFTIGKTLAADLVICADVIEHIIDPDTLVDFIRDISCQYVVISTPTGTCSIMSGTPDAGGLPQIPPTSESGVSASCAGTCHGILR